MAKRHSPFTLNLDQPTAAVIETAAAVLRISRHALLGHIVAEWALSDGAQAIVNGAQGLDFIKDWLQPRVMIQLSQEKLRLARLSRHLSMQQLARLAGYSYQAYQRVESAKDANRPRPSLELVACVAKVLGVTVDSLLEEVPDQDQPQ